MTQVPAVRRSVQLNVFRCRNDPGMPVVLAAPAHVAVKVAVNDCQAGTGLPACVLGKVREASR
jgi:hypothetical protein